jgi:hypothetical protein
MLRILVRTFQSLKITHSIPTIIIAFTIVHRPIEKSSSLSFPLFFFFLNQTPQQMTDLYVLPLCETVSVLLNECGTSDDATRVVLVSQIHHFFTEILQSTTATSTLIPKVAEIASSLFSILSNSLALFLADSSNAENLAKFVHLFLDSVIAPDIASEISSFVVSFLVGPFHASTGFCQMFESIGKFFSTETFVPVFEALGGLLAVWDLLLSPDKQELCDYVFNHFSTIHFYFQSTSTDASHNFLSFAAKSILNLPAHNVIHAFHFLFDLISSARTDLLTAFISFGGFKQINQYIQTHNDPQYLIVYKMFRSFCVSTSVNPDLPAILAQLIDLLELPDISDDIAFAALTTLAEAVRQFGGDRSPLQPHHLLPLSAHLDSRSKTIYIEICDYLSTYYSIDISPLVPAMSKLFKFSSAMEGDMSQILTLFQRNLAAFEPFALVFYQEVTKDATVAEVAQMINKYPNFLMLLPLCISDVDGDQKSLLVTLLKAADSIVNQTFVSRDIARFFAQERAVPLLLPIVEALTGDDKVISFLVKILIDSALNLSVFRNTFFEIGVAAFLRGISEKSVAPLLIFDLCAALTGGHFSVVIDTAIASFLKSVDFSDKTKPQFANLHLVFNKMEVLDRLDFVFHHFFIDAGISKSQRHLIYGFAANMESTIG